MTTSLDEHDDFEKREASAKPKQSFLDLLEADDLALEQELEQPEEPRTTVRWRWFRYGLTLEVALYGLIFIAAVLSRFINLDLRALHHDEGVHAWYSWRLFHGDGYSQEPWKHGPFLYHIQALIFWLFSDSDQTARVSTAIFGVLMCFLPLGLRKELGRWGALTASFLLLISPMFLYYSRFLREDIFTAFATMLLFIGLVRFVATPSTGWWVTAMVALALLFCTKEVSFFYLALFGGFLGVWLCWQLAPRLILILGGYLVGTLALFFFVMSLYPPPLIPYEKISGDALTGYVKSLLVHPVLWTFSILAILGIAVAWFAIHEVAANRRRFMLSREWIEPNTPALQALFAPYQQRGTVAYAVAWLGENKRSFFLGLGLAFAFYFTFFTGFFTDIPQGSVGVVSGLWYWMAQQGVARGNQPWFYYFFMMALYEPLAFMFGTVGGLLVIFQVLRYGFRRTRKTLLVETAKSSSDDELDAPGESSRKVMQEVEVAVRPAGNALWPGRRRRDRHPYFVPLFLVVWTFGSFALYTWASEKMPWLTVQVALPFILLAAWLMNEVWSGIESFFQSSEPREVVLWGMTGRFFFWCLVGSLTATGFLTYMLFLHLTASETRISQAAPNYNWILIWIPPAMVVLLFTAFFSFIGFKPGLKAATGVVFGLMCLYLVYTGNTYAFNSSDVALEMGVYTQTHPDTYRVVKELDVVTTMLMEQKRTPILYDNNLRTPLDFYFRDYIYKQRVSDFATLASERGAALALNDFPFILISDESLPQLNEANKRLLAENYISRHYMFHNWFEEGQYRNFDKTVEKQIAFLQGKNSEVSVRDANNNVVLNKNDVMTAERLQQLSGSPGVLDKLYNGNGGNSALLHLQETGSSLRTLLTPIQMSRLWRYVMFREQIQPVGRREFTLYIKKDYAGLWRQYADLLEFPISRPQ